MKVFITGGTGFIGKNLVQRMSHTTHTMYCLVRETSRTQELRDLGANIVTGNIMDRASLKKGMQGCDWVINLANVYSFWEADRDIYQRINVEGTRNVMECALEAGVSKVVHISSVVVYGKPSESPFNEETPVGPLRVSDYSRTKYEGDQVAWQLHREKHLPLVVVYPCAVLGSGDTKYTGEAFRRLIQRRLPATLFHDSVHTYVHVNDVVETILRAAEKPGNLGERYFAGNARLSLDEFYTLVSDIAGVPLPRLRMPDALVMLNARVLTWVADKIKRPPLFGMSIDAVRTLREGHNVDGSKVERELGIVYTPIRKAFEEECAWHRKAGARIWGGEERRGQARSRVDLPCDVKGLSHGQETSAKAHVVDLNQQGMYVAATTPLDEGTEINAHIMAVQFGNTFWVKGKVLRSTEQGMAIKFVGIAPREIDEVLNFRQK